MPDSCIAAVVLVRRCTLAVLIACALPLAGHAQETKTVGEILYLEGSVEVRSSGNQWSSADIEQQLRRTQQVRTGSAASVEIKWQNGTKSTVGPQATKKLGPLYDQIVAQSGQESEGIVGKFMDLFQGSSSSSNDVGGIRRASAEEDSPDPGALYWKTFEEVDFEDAQTQLREENYSDAVRKFHLFLQQHPGHTNAAKAKLGMGIGYLQLNNPVQARSALESLVADHPDDPLVDRARTLLDRLKE